MTLGANLLICGFCGTTPVIINLDESGRASWIDSYGIVGDGWQYARTMLCLQPWNSLGDRRMGGPWKPVPLEHCIYRVYEAKAAAHIASPQKIGEATTFQVLVGGKGRFAVKLGFRDSMHEVFELKHQVPERVKASKWTERDILEEWRLTYEAWP
jgi:hypothetical protein